MGVYVELIVETKKVKLWKFELIFDKIKWQTLIGKFTVDMVNENDADDTRRLNKIDVYFSRSR